MKLHLHVSLLFALLLAACGSGLAQPVGFTLLGDFEMHRYYVSNDRMTWPDARDMCVASGGHLVCIGSALENDFVTNLLPPYVGEYNLVWIGFSDNAEEGNWVWVNGEPIVYTNWNDGEPNDWGGEDFGMIYAIPEHPWNGKWNDTGYENPPFHCVLEMQIPCPDPDPAAGNISVIVPGPPTWTYRLEHLSGCIDKLIFTSFCTGTTGSVAGDALTAGWFVMAGGDGNDGDSIIFKADIPLNAGTLDGFQLNHPWCSDIVIWAVGENTGSVDGPLPVELTSFDAIAGDAHVRIVWSTKSESELDLFELTREGQMIAQVIANNSAIGANYSFTDENLSNGTTYSYQLLVVGLGGLREQIGQVSATPRASEVPSEFALLQNYPNPFNAATTIEFVLPEQAEISLTLHNLLGEKVAILAQGSMSAGEHRVNFDAGELSSGIYFYRLLAEEDDSDQEGR